MSVAIMERPPRNIMEVFNSLPEGTLAQVIENCLVMSPSPLDVHQKVSADIFLALYSFVKAHDLGTARYAPYDVYLDDQNVFQPDILFISKERLHLIEKKGLYGAPDLVIEILSPSTAKFDLQQKKAVYERCGVQEYWIVDPQSKAIHGYRLRNNSFEVLPKAIGHLNSDLLQTTFRF
jgi:Uma2 family endonuclease